MVLQYGVVSNDKQPSHDLSFINRNLALTVDALHGMGENALLLSLSILKLKSPITSETRLVPGLVFLCDAMRYGNVT
jgi:hypothetical protein